MMFQVGEKVVYPNQGVGTIENVSARRFGMQVERFYLLRLLSSSMTVIVPLSHAGDIGLRPITRNGELAKVLTFLSASECALIQDWKARYRENSEKMRAGGLLQISEVLKSLLVLLREKPLSFREKKMLDRARHMLVSELSISRGLKEYEAIEMLDRALSKAGLALPAPL